MPGSQGIAETMMSEHQKHTEFLKHCLRYDDDSEEHGLHEELSRIQRDLRSVQRAILFLALVIALTSAGLICRASFPYNAQPFIVTLLDALIVGSLISVVAFAGLWILFRLKLHRRREECRQLLTRLLASRLGNASQRPATPVHEEKPGIDQKNSAYPG